MIESIRFKFGPTPGAEPTSFRPGPMTVIVGPNNSGKSLTLRELKKSLSEKIPDWSDKKWLVLADIAPGLPEAGPTHDGMVEEVEKDFAPLRNLDFGDPGLEFLFNLVGGRSEELGDLPPLLLEAVKRVLMLLSKRKIAMQLASDGKLSNPITSMETLVPASPTVEPTDMDDIILGKLDEIVGLLKQSHKGLLHLLNNVQQRPARDLILSGIVNLRGYFEHIQGPVAFLDGKTRLSLIQPERTGSLRTRRSEEGMLMSLRNDRKQLDRLRKYVLDAFGRYAVLDILDLQELKLVLSDAPPPANIEDRLDDEARAYFQKCTELSEFSDGVRTYIGLHAHLLSQDCNYAMIDEPEAFLHPPLARRLGANLTSLAAERGTYIFAATHSPDFVMGCLSTGHPVNIIRLGYKDGHGSARLLDPARLAEMMQDPLVRSTGALSALFHEAVVLCEGPSDRVFYSEINERLVRHDASYPRRMQSCLFLEVGGKEAVPKVFEPLIRTGVPVACVIDLDLLNAANVLNKLLKARGAHDTLVSSLTNMRGQVLTIFKDRKDLLKRGGIAALTDPAERAALQTFLDNLARFGIFLPERGEVETWLPALGCLGVGKSGWLPAILEKMGTTDGGLAPAPDDVWAFLRRLAAWLDQPLAP
jgi:hypothetical protein